MVSGRRMVGQDIPFAGMKAPFVPNAGTHRSFHPSGKTTLTYAGCQHEVAPPLA